MARIPAGVKTITYKSGTVRYEIRVDAEVNGVRRQKRLRFKTVTDASEKLKELRAAAAQGKLVPTTGLTVKKAIESWLASQRISPSTRAAYAAALAPVVERYGMRKVQTITKDDVDKLIADLQEGAGPGGRQWARTSINPMRARWESVWTDLVAQGKIAKNDVALVKPLRKRDDPERKGVLDLTDRLTDAEVTRLEAAHPATPPAEGHLRSPGYLAALRAPMIALGLIGLRRGEMAGLRWSSIDLDRGTMKVAVTTRIAVRGKVIEQNMGKTEAAGRWLPVPDPTLVVLRAAKARQDAERARYGERWRGGDDPFVLTQPDGRPCSPRTLNFWWNDALALAKVPQRRLHASRHTAASRLIAMGVTPAEVAAWLGHSDGGELVLKTYAHVHKEELHAVAAALDYSRERVLPEDRGPVHWIDQELPARALQDLGMVQDADGNWEIE